MLAKNGWLPTSISAFVLGGAERGSGNQNVVSSGSELCLDDVVEERAE